MNQPKQLQHELEPVLTILQISLTVELISWQQPLHSAQQYTRHSTVWHGTAMWRTFDKHSPHNGHFQKTVQNRRPETTRTRCCRAGWSFESQRRLNKCTHTVDHARSRSRTQSITHAVDHVRSWSPTQSITYTVDHVRSRWSKQSITHTVDDACRWCC